MTAIPHSRLYTAGSSRVCAPNQQLSNFSSVPTTDPSACSVLNAHDRKRIHSNVEFRGGFFHAAMNSTQQIDDDQTTGDFYDAEANLCHLSLRH